MRQPGQPRLAGPGDVVQDVDVTDAAAHVGEPDLEAVGRPGDVEMKQVPVLLDEEPVGVGDRDQCCCREEYVSSVPREANSRSPPRSSSEPGPACRDAG